MNRNRITLVVGSVLFVIFLSLLFAFQVRQNEVAFLTTFGVATGEIKPGLHFKWPWPIQKVHRFDGRLHNFEGKFEETLTSDARNLMVLVYAGWRVLDPRKFQSNFGGDVEEAKRNLEGLVRSAKNAVVGQHPFSHFISTDPAQLKFDQIEKEMLALIQEQAKVNYGVEVKFLGIKRLGLPESITQRVFERMKEERQRDVKRYEGEGESEASKIRSAAELARNRLLAEAEADATKSRGQAEAKAAEAYRKLEENPALAVFLQKLSSMEQIARERTTLIIDQNTPPFDLLSGTNTLVRPAAPKH